MKENITDLNEKKPEENKSGEKSEKIEEKEKITEEDKKIEKPEKEEEKDKIIEDANKEEKIEKAKEDNEEEKKDKKDDIKVEEKKEEEKEVPKDDKEKATEEKQTDEVKEKTIEEYSIIEGDKKEDKPKEGEGEGKDKIIKEEKIEEKEKILEDDKKEEKPKEDMKGISENKIEISDSKEPNKGEIKQLEITQTSDVIKPEKEEKDLKDKNAEEEPKKEEKPQELTIEKKEETIEGKVDDNKKSSLEIENKTITQEIKPDNKDDINSIEVVKVSKEENKENDTKANENENEIVDGQIISIIHGKKSKDKPLEIESKTETIINKENDDKNKISTESNVEVNGEVKEKEIKDGQNADGGKEKEKENEEEEKIESELIVQLNSKEEDGKINLKEGQKEGLEKDIKSASEQGAKIDIDSNVQIELKKEDADKDKDKDIDKENIGSFTTAQLEIKNEVNEPKQLEEKSGSIEITLNNEEDNKDQPKEGKVILKGKPKSKLEMEIGKTEVKLEGENKDKEDKLVDKKDEKETKESIEIKVNENGDNNLKIESKEGVEIKDGDKNTEKDIKIALQQSSTSEQILSGDKKDDGKSGDINKLSIEQQINIDGNNQPLTSDSNLAINIEGSINKEGKGKEGDLASLEIAKSTGQIMGAQASSETGLLLKKGGNIIPGSESQIQIQVTGDASIQGNIKNGELISQQFDIENFRLMLLVEKMTYYETSENEIVLETKVQEMNGLKYETIDYDKLKIVRGGIFKTIGKEGGNGEVLIQHNEFNINSSDKDGDKNILKAANQIGDKSEIHIISGKDTQKEKKEGSELIIESINNLDGNENKLNKKNELTIENTNNEEINKNDDKKVDELKIENINNEEINKEEKKDELKIESQNNEENKKDDKKEDELKIEKQENKEEDKKEEDKKNENEDEAYYNLVNKIVDGMNNDDIK